MADDDNKGFAALMAEMGAEAPSRGPSVGDQVTGTVVAIDGQTVFVDVGAKAEAVLERSELDDEHPVKVGDSLKAFVVARKGGQISLGMRLGRGDDAAALQQAHDAGMPVLGKVSAVNKGGLEVDVGGMRAFCPLSQIDIARVDDPAIYVGQELEFAVTKLESEGKGRFNVVVSRRVLLEKQRASLAAETLSKLAVGAIVRGKVSHIKEFGAFVDLGGLDGLLHKSELGFGRVVKTEDVVSVGDVVEAQVTRIEPPREPGQSSRISLSLKALQKDPWDELVATVPKGAQRTGKVVRLESFGAFIELADGLDGLVHVSELADRRVGHPREVVSPGQEVDVVVLDIDSERRRLALSMKQVAAQQEAAQAAGYRPASKQSLGTFADLMKKKHNR